MARHAERRPTYAREAPPTGQWQAQEYPSPESRRSRPTRGEDEPTGRHAMVDGHPTGRHAAIPADRPTRPAPPAGRRSDYIAGYAAVETGLPGPYMPPVQPPAPAAPPRPAAPPGPYVPAMVRPIPAEPPRAEPPRREPRRPELPHAELPHAEPPHAEPPHAEPPHAEPPHAELQRVRRSRADRRRAEPGHEPERPRAAAPMARRDARPQRAARPYAPADRGPTGGYAPVQLPPSFVPPAADERAAHGRDEPPYDEDRYDDRWPAGADGPDRGWSDDRGRGQVPADDRQADDRWSDDRWSDDRWSDDRPTNDRWPVADGGWDDDDNQRERWHAVRLSRVSRRASTSQRRGRRTARRVVASLLTAGVLAAIATVAAGYQANQPNGAGQVPAVATGPCDETGPGQRDVEAFLSTRGKRFGQVQPDAKQSAGDCRAIGAFQRWAEIPNPTGFADATTGEVARRLAEVRLGDCGEQTGATTVCVDLTHQAMWVVKSGRIVLGPTVARTGRPGEVTPTGEFTITQKKVDTISSEYGTRLPYWQRFFSDYGFHAADTPMYARIGGSFGCVNLLMRDAKALYGMTEIGTIVRLFGKKPGT